MSNIGTVIMKTRGVILGLIAACSLVLPCNTFAQTSAQSPIVPAHLLSLARWRHTMVKSPLPGKGCFTTSYPDTEWHEIQCVTAPPRPPTPPHMRRPVTRGGAAMVGDGTDFSAQVASGTAISQGEGAFIQPSDVSSESGGGVTNEFSLQLNANTFTTSACNGVSGCLGWAQFVYANPYQTDSGPASYGAAFIQYWLLNYGTSCPSGWASSNGSCFYNSPIVEVPLQTIASLRSEILTGKPGSGGSTDTVVFSVDGTLYSASNGISDPDIGLVGNWNTAEFNVFGDGGGSEATFNTGATIAVTTSVYNGTSSAPSCTQAGTTGETNSLTLVTPCCPFKGTASGASPGITFLESSASPAPTADCSVLTHPYAWLAAVDQFLLH